MKILQKLFKNERLKESWFWINQATLISGLIMLMIMTSILIYKILLDGFQMNLLVLVLILFSFVTVGIYTHLKKASEHLKNKKKEIDMDNKSISEDIEFIDSLIIKKDTN